MVRLNPFCDNDARSGMQFFSGINIMMTAMTLVVNVLAIAEISYFHDYWDEETHFIKPFTAVVLLLMDVLVIALQIHFGFNLYTAVSENAYMKIRRWRFPSVVLILLRLLTLSSFFISTPASPFFSYFTIICFGFSLFIFWPVQRYLHDFANLPVNETSRLLGRVD